jgi:hypothetical protein
MTPPTATAKASEPQQPESREPGPVLRETMRETIERHGHQLRAAGVAIGELTAAVNQNTEHADRQYLTLANAIDELAIAEGQTQNQLIKIEKKLDDLYALVAKRLGVEPTEET